MRQIQHLALLFAFVIALGACNSPTTSTDKPQVVATTSIVADVTRYLCGSFADVTSLMGPGVDPHLYKASHSDIGLLSNADVIVYNGLHLEGKMSDVLHKLSSQKTVIALSDGLDKTEIRAINADADVYDPHFWFDVDLWSKGVQHLSSVLIERFPAHAAEIRVNTRRFQHEADSIQSQCKALVSALPRDKRILITSHDAFYYFGSSFEFTVKGLQGISTLSESGLKDVTDMVNYIIDNEVKAVFVENSVPQKALRSVIDGCSAKGHEVVIGGELFSDALGADRTPEGSYLGMIHYNVETIVNALK